MKDDELFKLKLKLEKTALGCGKKFSDSYEDDQICGGSYGLCFECCTKYDSINLRIQKEEEKRKKARIDKVKACTQPDEIESAKTFFYRQDLEGVIWNSWVCPACLDKGLTSKRFDLFTGWENEKNGNRYFLRMVCVQCGAESFCDLTKSNPSRLTVREH